MLIFSLMLAAAQPDLNAMARRFAPAPITVDLGGMPDNERQALQKLVMVAHVMDGIFLRQVWSGNASMLLALQGQPALPYFLLNKGPWSRLDQDVAFVSGVAAKPRGAGFYPEDAAKPALEAWFATLPEAERARATGFYSVIHRDGASFVTTPYSVEYQGELWLAAKLMREAAALTAQPTLKTYLTKRADAFASNDYYDSEVAWMSLDSSIEPTIGPYEVYEDDLFNYKAAFEAFITVRDEAASKRLAALGAELQGLENALPIDPALRNVKLGGLAPIRVVNVVVTAGDAAHGVMTAAYNLPNDERVVKEKGSKRVMLKNVQEAKFHTVLEPIAALTLAGGTHIDFDAFFTHILMHELMHGLGPHQIKIAGHASTVRQELKDTYSALEEAKADVSGLWAMQRLVDKGVLDKKLQATMYTTFVASAFRTLRFGLSEAHGKGMAVQLAHYLKMGAVTLAKDGSFTVDNEKMRQATESLTRELMTLQAHGDYAAATKLLAASTPLSAQLQGVLTKLNALPVDIAPHFISP